MKYQWEAHDVAVGRKVDSHNRAERYIIGYDVAINTEDGNLLMVSLRDGMLAKSGETAESMAKHLNESGMRPICVRAEDVSAKAA
jgi:hypothetical protein